MTAPPRTSLQRAIRLPHATAMVVGTIIGASIFVQPSEVTSQVHSVGGVLLVWLAAGALTLIGSLVCAELASTFTRTGGVYVYLSEAFHPALGFLWGWAMLLTMHSGIIAAIATVFARYTAFFVPLGDAGSRAVAIAVILVLSAVNFVGVKHGSRLQTWFTAGKVLAIVAIVFTGLALGGRVPQHFVASAATGGDPIGGFLLAMAAGLFAYGGWHMVTYSAEETVEPAKTIPRALLIGTLVVTAAYMAMNAIYLYVMPLDRVAASTRVAADLADTLLGSGGGAAMSAVVMFSSFGALAGIILAGPRVYYAMAQDGVLFRWLGELHPKYATPHRAILLQAFWASLLVATGTFRALFTRVIYTEWLFFGLMAIGLILLRRRGVPRQYSIWGYPVTPVLFAIASFAIVARTLASNPGDGIIGLGLVAVGLPIYILRTSWTRAQRTEESETAGR
ncbi:MAG TPA: amino acid permease [Gemmatimonadaceae bacterium]|nr:amino acid permease [Gemmatimonadaceae bacterium]